MFLSLNINRENAMGRPFIEGQTIDYYVLYALENNKHQACYIEMFLCRKHQKEFTRSQISNSLQRLKKEGLAKYNGRWDRVIK